MKVDFFAFALFLAGALLAACLPMELTAQHRHADAFGLMRREEDWSEEDEQPRQAFDARASRSALAHAVSRSLHGTEAEPEDPAQLPSEKPPEEEPEEPSPWSPSISTGLTERRGVPINALRCESEDCASISTHFSDQKDQKVRSEGEWVSSKTRFVQGSAENQRSLSLKCPDSMVVTQIDLGARDSPDSDRVRLRLFCQRVPDWIIDNSMQEDHVFFTSTDSEAFVSECAKGYLLAGIGCFDVSCKAKRLMCRQVRRDPINCEWMAWGVWSACDPNGKMTRTRRRQEEKYGGLTCEGKDEIVEYC